MSLKFKSHVRKKEVKPPRWIEWRLKGRKVKRVIIGRRDTSLVRPFGSFDDIK